MLYHLINNNTFTRLKNVKWRNLCLSYTYVKGGRFKCKIVDWWGKALVIGHSPFFLSLSPYVSLSHATLPFHTLIPSLVSIFFLLLPTSLRNTIASSSLYSFIDSSYIPPLSLSDFYRLFTILIRVVMMLLDLDKVSKSF